MHFLFVKIKIPILGNHLFHFVVVLIRTLCACTGTLHSFLVLLYLMLLVGMHTNKLGTRSQRPRTEEGLHHNINNLQPSSFLLQNYDAISLPPGVLSLLITVQLSKDSFFCGYSLYSVHKRYSLLNLRRWGSEALKATPICSGLATAGASANFSPIIVLGTCSLIFH